MKKSILYLASTIFLFASCEKESFDPAPTGSNNPVVNDSNDANRIIVRTGSALSREMQNMDQAFQLQGKGANLSYAYKAYASQPVLNGTPTEATSIVAEDNWVFVSWHTEGPPYGGAISAYENTGSGYVYREVLEFDDTDWHDLEVHKDGATISVYMAGQRNPDSSQYFLSGHRGAVTAKVEFNTLAGSNLFDLNSYIELPLQGFAANGIALDISDNSVITVSGGGTGSTADTSGMYRIPVTYSNVSQVFELEDGKYIERNAYSDADEFVALELNGSDLRTYAFGSGFDFSNPLFSNSLTPSSTIDHERNALAWNAHDEVLVATGYELVRFRIGLGQVGPPIPVDSRVLGVTVDVANHLVYAACGEGGLHVLANLGYSGGALINDFDLIGKFIPPSGGAFPNQFYVKDAAIYQEDNISIATGEAGVFFVEKQ